MDVLSSEQRRLNMSRIRGRDTGPEILVRKALHAKGHRFRLHRRDLPGSPDLVLPKWRVAVFVHGCFWHRHACPYFKMPTTRREFWEQKITRNVQRDVEAQTALKVAGWRTLIVWECALRGRQKLTPDELMDAIENFMMTGETAHEIQGKWL